MNCAHFLLWLNTLGLKVLSVSLYVCECAIRNKEMSEGLRFIICLKNLQK